MNILLAGPWIGEFGWELFCWQGHIRKLSESYDKVIVIGRPGHKILYNDFCDEYIDFEPNSYLTNGWRCDKSSPYKDLVASIEHTHYLDGQFDIGMNYEITGVNDLRGLFFNQKFHKYQPTSEVKGYDIILHARNKQSGAVRNWDESKWNDLSKELSNYNVACIGNEEAFCIEGADDLRGISLEELINVMCVSKLIVSPSSGPMHLASLCGLKHLVWSTDFNKVRYERDWNPFNTEVIFYDGGEWNPEVSIIKELIDKNI